MTAAFGWIASALRRHLECRHRLHRLVTVMALMSTLLFIGATRVDAQEVVEYYATDAVGSIRVVFAPDGTVKARSDYLPFGEEWGGATPGGPLPSQRFTGQQRDAEENLDHFISRSYQTRTGRLNSVDSVFSGLFEPQRWNRYAYALNNPLSYVDPDGRDTIKFSDIVTVRPDPNVTYMNWITLPWHLTGGNYTIDGLRGLAIWQFEEYDRHPGGIIIYGCIAPSCGSNGDTDLGTSRDSESDTETQLSTEATFRSAPIASRTRAIRTSSCRRTIGSVNSSTTAVSAPAPCSRLARPLSARV